MKIRKALALGMVGVLPALTGCLSHTRYVPKTRVADVIISTSLEAMAKQLDSRYAAMQTFNARVDVAATTGGGLQGKEIQYTSFAGIILMRKPETPSRGPAGPGGPDPGARHGLRR